MFFGFRKRYAEEINQELYKRNVELAFHNKMLSLLRRLYSITLTSFNLEETARGLIQEVSQALNLKLVRFFFTTEEEGKINLRIVASAPNNLPRFLGDSIQKNSVIYQKVFIEKTPFFVEDTDDFYSKTYGFEGRKEVKDLLKNVSVSFFPIVIDSSVKGLLFIVYSKKYSQLTSYENEAIENFASLISIAIDKSIIYEQLEGANEKLEEQNLRLQELDRQKTDFLSIAAHQLRTPLSILNGYIELIKDGGYGKVGAKVKEILDNMDQSNGRLVHLVDEFLNITRIEQGRTKYDFKPCDINLTVDSVVEELRDRASQAGLHIEWSSPDTMEPVSMDEEKVRNVVFNFVDNAIKYSTEGKITVTAKIENGGLALRVRDEGFGFDKVDQVNFFQKFYRGENVKGTNVNGTGLGLYVCRMFIEAHKGKVWAKSEGLGKGSEFGFWIPVHQ